MRSSKGYLILVILVLALIGLGYELLSNPVGLLTKTLIGIGILTVFVLLFRFIMARRSGGAFYSAPKHSSPRPTRAQLAKAKRTSSKKTTPLFTQTGKDGRSKPSRALHRKNANHLTVIEGRKNKKKNRALF